MNHFKNKVVFITGASRGIGKAIGIKLAQQGANIVIAAKSVEENPALGGTIYTAAKEMENAGGKALAVQTDIRFEEQIIRAIQQTIAAFGKIDILINNASAIYLLNTQQLQAKQFDLMHDINVRGTFLVTKHCIPYLKQAGEAHILTLSPPLNMQMKWLSPHIAYTMSKYNMSMMALAWSQELKKDFIASNALWPATTINTAAVKNLLGGETLVRMSRSVNIMADAAFHILSKKPAECTGNTFTDEEVLRKEGITNFDDYSMVPGAPLQSDLFL